MHGNGTYQPNGDDTTEWMSKSIWNVIMTVLSFVITGAIGYVTTTQGNPREDTTLLIWVALLSACIIIVTIIWKKNSAHTIDSMVEAQHAEVIERLDNQDGKIDRVLDAQQQSMRAQLVHNAEKYIERDWLTGEELQTWEDMYQAYEALPGENGYIAAYKARLETLDIKGLSAIQGHKERGDVQQGEDR